MANVDRDVLPGLGLIVSEGPRGGAQARPRENTAAIPRRLATIRRNSPWTKRRRALPASRKPKQERELRIELRLAEPLLHEPCWKGGPMLDSIRKTVALPRVAQNSAAIQGSAELAVSVGVILTFLWLLLHDRVHPFVIYLAQLYLTL